MNAELIDKIAARHGLPPELIAAIIEVESSGDPFAYRFEPDFYTRYIQRQVNLTPVAPCSIITEKTGRATSWGLMQIMGQVARERGFKGPFLSALCDPETGIEYGCRHFAHLGKQYRTGKDWTPVIAAYNAGSPRKDGSRYVNQSYVNKVLSAWTR